MEFYSGSDKLGESAGVPYSHLWASVPPGTYWLTAIATDDRGAVSVSAPVEIAVAASACATTTTASPADSAESSAALRVYFGQDRSPHPPFGANQVPRPSDTPISKRAAATFLARLPGIAAESFEGFAPGVSPSQITFGTNQVALSGEQSVLEVADPGSTFNGEFAISGTRGLELVGNSGTGFFRLRFSAPQAAFGFFATDIELNGLNVTLFRTDQSTQDLTVPVRLPQGTAGALFYGVIDPVNPFVEVQLSRAGNLEDSFLFDDLILASPAQLVPEFKWPVLSISDPASLTLAGGLVNQAKFPLSLSQPPTNTVTVEYFTLDGTAKEGAGYLKTNGVVQFAPGQTSALIGVKVLPAGIVADGATFAVQLRNPSNALLGRCEATATIRRPANTPPTISAIPAQQTTRNTPIAAILITIGDLETPVERLVVTAQSSESRLVSQDGLVLAGNGSVRTLTLRPALDQLGSCTIILTVADADGESASAFFQVTVVPMANTPPTVRILQPSARTIFQIGEAIRIEAEPADNEGAIAKVEFLAGTSKLAEIIAAPYVFTWSNATEGDYVITAVAVDQEGAAGRSEPVRIAVSDVCGSAAIIATAGDPSVDLLQEYLYELGIRSSAFDRDEITGGDFAVLGLVIWNDAGTSSLTDSDVALFQQLVSAGKPLYFIGENLPGNVAELSAVSRQQWTELVGLSPMTIGNAPARVEIDRENVGVGGVAAVIADGKVGTVADFDYAFSTQGGIQNASEARTVLAGAGMFDVLVAHEFTAEGGSGRRLTQAFRVTGGSDALSLEQRKKLFQNAVWWLLDCRLCSNLNLRPEGTSLPGEVAAGGSVVYTISIETSGGCEALGVSLTSQLPPSLEFQGASAKRGSWSYADHRVTFTLGRLTRDMTGEHVEIIARPAATGTLTNMISLRSLNESGGALEDNQLQIVTEVTGGLRLAIERAGPGEVRIGLSGPAGRSCVLEASANAVDWQPIADLVTGTAGSFVIEPVSRTAAGRIYRARFQP